MLVSLVATLAMQSSRLAVGTSWSGEEVLHFFSKATEIDETHRIKLAFRVTGTEANMLVVERRSNLLGTRVMDTDIPPPPDSSPAISKEWLSPMGFLLDADPFEKGEFNLDRLIHFWLPSNQPEKWSVDLVSTTTHFIPKGRADFKRLARAGEYSLSYSSPENPDEITASGTLRFDLRSGRLLSAKIDANHAHLPGGTERANVTLTYTDSQITKPLD